MLRWPHVLRPFARSIGLRARSPAFVFALGALVGCHRAFACEQDDECHLDGVAGRCEDTGGCSFPDDDCPSGWRYGSHARAALAGRCVAAQIAEGTGTTGLAGSSSGAADTAVGTTTTGASSDAGESGPFDPCVDGLQDSAPIVADTPGQVISGLRISASGTPGITVDGVAGVTIRDCEIHHHGAPGLVFRAADDLVLSNVVVIHDAAPPAGPHADSDQINIAGSDSERVAIDHVRVVAGSTGIELANTPAVQLAFVESHDVRGPGAAACIHLEDSDDAVIEDFSCENPLDTSRPGDIVEIATSSNVTVRRGMLDGNNAQFGYGVHFSQISGQHSGGLVEDVDAIRMTNGAFSCFPFGKDITFRRTRARENICEIVSVEIPDCQTLGPNGGCVPGSGGLSWAGSSNSSGLVLDDSAYFAVCSEVLWPTEVFSYAPEDLIEQDFELRAPIRIAPCWE